LSHLKESDTPDIWKVKNYVFKIALRNLLRNKRRTLIILSSIIIGVASTLIYDSINAGMMNSDAGKPD